MIYAQKGVGQFDPPPGLTIQFLTLGGLGGGMASDCITSIGLNIIVYFMVLGGRLKCLKTFLKHGMSKNIP